MSTDPFVVRSSPVRYLLLLLVSVGFVTIGVDLVERTPHVLVGWLNIVFFGIATLTFLWQIVDTRPRLLIDHRGVYDRTLGVGVIPWSEIVDVEVRWTAGQPFVALTLRDPSLFTRRLPPVQRLLARGNRALGFQELNLNLGGLSVDPEDVMLRLRRGLLPSLAARRPVGQNPPA